MSHIIREVQAPYTINLNDEAVGRETIILQRDGKPVAAVVPYEEYQALVTMYAIYAGGPAHRMKAENAQVLPASDSEFERNRAAFYRLLAELLKDHHGEWVAIVDEQPVQFGPNFQSVIVPVRARFGQRPIYVQEIAETPRIHKMPSPRVVRQ